MILLRELLYLTSHSVLCSHQTVQVTRNSLNETCNEARIGKNLSDVHPIKFFSEKKKMFVAVSSRIGKKNTIYLTTAS